MRQLDSVVAAARLRKASPTEVDLKPYFKNSVGVLRQLKGDIAVFSSREQTPRDLRDARESLFPGCLVGRPYDAGADWRDKALEKAEIHPKRFLGRAAGESAIDSGGLHICEGFEPGDRCLYYIDFKSGRMTTHTIQRIDLPPLETIKFSYNRIWNGRQSS